MISREYSAEWKPGDEPYYPVNDEANGALYAKYKELADAQPNVLFGGRLGEYKYYDMDRVIEGWRWTGYGPNWADVKKIPQSRPERGTCGIFADRRRGCCLAFWVVIGYNILVYLCAEIRHGGVWER